PGQKRSRNYVAARVAELVGTRLAGFTLEIFEPGGAGKRGTRYRLLRTEAEKYDGHAKASASSASSAMSGKSQKPPIVTKPKRLRMVLITPRPSADHPQAIGVQEVEQNQRLTASDADSADSADGFARPSPGAGGEPPGSIIANGFAISATPEDRREPEPGQLS